MPRNTGTAPECELVDIKFRNGRVVRSTEPRKWRWTRDDPEYPAQYKYDIHDWQEVK